MCNSQVSNIIGASMATLQPLSTFTFTSVVDQVIDRIGLTVPTKPKKDGDPGVPVPDEAGSHQVGSQYLNAQFKVLLRKVCEGNEDTRPSWYKPEGLHLEYWKDFESRYPNYVAPTLPVSIFDQAKEEMRQLRELVPHAPPADLRVMGADKLWQEICNTSPSQRQKKFESILEAQWHHQLRPQPDLLAPSAPTRAPKDPEPLEPEGGGDPGDPEVKEYNRPQVPPSRPPGPPLEPLVIQAQPQVKEEPEVEEKPKAKDGLVTPNDSAGLNKRTRSSKADPEEPPAKRPTQPRAVGPRTLEGEAASKGKASKLKCNVSLKRILTSDRSYIFKSDGGEGEFDDEDEEEEDNSGIEIPDPMGTVTRVMLPTIAKIPSQTPRRSLMMRRTLARRSIPKRSPTRTKGKSSPPTTRRARRKRRRRMRRRRKKKRRSLRSPEGPRFPSSSGYENTITRSSLRTLMRPTMLRASS